MQKNRPMIGCSGASLLPKLFRGFGPNHWKLRAEDLCLKTATKALNRPSGPHWFLWNWHLKLHSHSPLLFRIMRVMMFIDLIYFNRLKTDPLISIVCLVWLSMKTKTGKWAFVFARRILTATEGWVGTAPDTGARDPATRKIYTHHSVDCWLLNTSQTINYKSFHFFLIPLEGDSYRLQGWCNNRIVESHSFIHSFIHHRYLAPPEASLGISSQDELKNENSHDFDLEAPAFKAQYSRLRLSLATLSLLLCRETWLLRFAECGENQSAQHLSRSGAYPV